MCGREKGQCLIMERGRERTLVKKKMVDGRVFMGARSSRSACVEGNLGAGFSEDGWDGFRSIHVWAAVCVGESLSKRL